MLKNSFYILLILKKRENMKKIIITSMLAVMFSGAMENKQDIHRFTRSSKDIQQLKNLITQGANVNKVDKNGYTPLFIAVENGNLEAVKALIDAGADVKAKTRNGTSMLTNAILMDEDLGNQYDIIKLLMDNGAGQTLHPNDIELAESNENRNIMKLLKQPLGAQAYRLVNRHHYYNTPKDAYNEMEKHEKPINIDMESVD
jgi:Ankyrin repeats (3 copies)